MSDVQMGESSKAGGVSKKKVSKGKSLDSKKGWSKKKSGSDHKSKQKKKGSSAKSKKAVPSETEKKAPPPPKPKKAPRPEQLPPFPLGLQKFLPKGAKFCPEGVLKKRDAIEKAQKEGLAYRRAMRRSTMKKRVVQFKKAEKYVKEYRDEAKELIRLRREARSVGKYFREPEPRVAFVIRIRGIRCVAPKTRKILQLLRLTQVHNGIFLKLNRSSLVMLRLVSPYVTWGYPTQEVVRELVYKRGHVKIHGTRTAIRSNSVIEKGLGKLGIVCVEDLIHEIYTCGKNFPKANNFLTPFHLSTPLGGYSKKGKKVGFTEGGEAGNREQYINTLVRRMN